jgi:small-conductance mechanosensitive channel
MDVGWVDFWAQARVLGVRVASGVCMLAVFWMLARVVEKGVIRVSQRVPQNRELLELLARTAKITLLVFGTVTAFGTMGINVSAMVAGLGLTGFALGFALRDVLSNILSGVLLLLYRPFGRGDHIAVAGMEGVVTAIDLRYTTLAQGEKTILIPNSNLFTTPIVVSGPAATAHQS